MKGAKFKIGDIVTFSYTVGSDKYTVETEILQILKSVDGIEYIVYDTYNAVRPNDGKGHVLTTVREDILTLKRRPCETVKIDTNFKISQQSSTNKVITVKGMKNVNM